MTDALTEDALIRAEAFKHVRRLQEIHDPLGSEHLSAGFIYLGERLPLINQRRGIFKPQRMRYLLSIRTVFPKPGAKVWYDDQREVHRQIYEGDQTVNYAFLGDAAIRGLQNAAFFGAASNDSSIFVLLLAKGKGVIYSRCMCNRKEPPCSSYRRSRSTGTSTS